MKYKYLLLVLSFIVISKVSYAQFEDFEDEEKSQITISNNEKKKKDDKSFLEKYTFGGNLGFGLGNSMAYIETEPFFGYRFNKVVSAGVTATYMFYSYDEDILLDSYRTSVYGAGVFADVYPIRSLVLHAEVSGLNFDNKFDGYGNYYIEKNRQWDMPVILGIGYHMSFNEYMGINYMLLWNVNDSNGLKYNVYSNPIIRISFVF
ncbi:MAG: hypothetical protein MJ211_03310 [Bacteroidales bacterium]|nr:hypothetical protein [Bacteroidales bacterium]